MKNAHVAIAFFYVFSNILCLAWIPAVSTSLGMNLQMQMSKSPVPIAIDKKIVGLGAGDSYFSFLFVRGYK
jgi:amino acid permease